MERTTPLRAEFSRYTTAISLRRGSNKAGMVPASFFTEAGIFQFSQNPTVFNKS